MPVNLTCPMCGAAFGVKASTVTRRRYCSRICWSAGVEASNRTPLVITGGVAKVPLYARDKSVRAYALIDAADAERVSQYRWYVGSGGYATHSLSRRREEKNPVEIKLHRFLMGLRPGDLMQVDHINRDRLDNRRSNLRLVTAAEQAQNQGSSRGSSSKYRGVVWHRRIGKWQASIRIDNRLTHLGYFTDEDEAGRVAQEARLRLMPHAVD